jgi:hypothetical protein
MAAAHRRAIAHTANRLHLRGWARRCVTDREALIAIAACSILRSGAGPRRSGSVSAGGAGLGTLTRDGGRGARRVARRGRGSDAVAVPTRSRLRRGRGSPFARRGRGRARAARSPAVGVSSSSGAVSSCAGSRSSQAAGSVVGPWRSRVRRGPIRHAVPRRGAGPGVLSRGGGSVRAYGPAVGLCRLGHGSGEQCVRRAGRGTERGFRSRAVKGDSSVAVAT